MKDELIKDERENHDYQRGYSDGYKDGYMRGLEFSMEIVKSASKPIPMIVTFGDILSNAMTGDKPGKGV